MKNVRKNLEIFFSKAVVFTYSKLARPVSIFFRKVFEFKKVKEIVGGLVLTSTLVSGILPSSFSTLQTSFDTRFVQVKPEAIELTTKESLQRPVEIFRLTKGYSFFHPGIDFATDAGTAVLPILPGKVEKIALGRFGYGNHVIINHGSGFKSLYAHFSKINVKEGQEVDKETIIGLVGSTGWSTGPHLHLEIQENDQKINPKALFEAYFGRKLASTR